jgi:hypothetical protein
MPSTVNWKEGSMHWALGLWRSRRVRDTLSLVVAATAFAGTSPSTGVLAATVSQPSQPSAQTAGQRLQFEIKLLDRYVVTNADRTLALEAPANVLRHVDRSDMALLEAGLAVVNRKIQAGELKVEANHRLTDVKATTFNIQWNWTGRRWFWWGEQDWFSEYWTLKIEAAYNMGAAAGGICAVIAAALGAEPVAILCGIAAAVLAFGSAWMQWADNGGGVVISQTWTPFPLGGIWISGQ